ncbi:MAG TPA: hypothetical protein VNO74_03395 [Methylomirabilota bacterium]|nr:hypothetical protein [Methylomirabilota bacterium]
MRYATNFAVAIGAGIAMAFVAGCAPTTHVTETTTTREYDTKNPPVVMAPVATSNTTTTTQYDNGTVQRTYSQPTPYASADTTTTTVTTDTNNGAVQKQTTTTYSTPNSDRPYGDRD